MAHYHATAGLAQALSAPGSPSPPPSPPLSPFQESGS